MAGCDITSSIWPEGEGSKLWKGPEKREKDKPVYDPPKPAETPKSPLQIRATATGPVIQFTITNTGGKSIPLTRDDFALLVPGGRRIVRYDSFTTNLEINPWPSTLAPGQAVNGRAIFHEIQDPVAHRLVVNPRTGSRSDAAFAVIMSPSAFQQAMNAPVVSPTETIKP